MNNANEAAFPAHADGEGKGLTKREYFAAMAMQSFIEVGYTTESAKSLQIVAEANGTNDYPRTIAMMALEHADALLAELEK